MNGLRRPKRLVKAGLLLCSVMAIDRARSQTETTSWAQLTPYRARGVEAPGPSTMATVRRDAGDLVVTVFCAEPNMDKLAATHTESDDPSIYADDSIEVFVRTEKENHFHLIANSLGAVYDKYMTEVRTLEWDSDAEVQVEKTNADSVTAADGWKITVRVPLGSLTSAQTVSPWRINVCRNRRVPGADNRAERFSGMTAVDDFDPVPAPLVRPPLVNPTATE